MKMQRFFGSLAVVAALIGSQAASASELIEKAKRTAFPSSTVPSLDGKSKVTPGNMKGKVVIVDFWAHWCEPCKIELPKLNELAKKYKSKGLVVIGVNVDEKKEDATGFLKEHPVQIPLAYDGDKKVLIEQVKIDKMPTSFILDKTGKIAVRHEAFKAGDEAKIEAAIQKLLAEK